MNQKRLFGQPNSTENTKSTSQAPVVPPKKAFPKLNLSDGFDSETAKAECIFWHRIQLGTYIKQLNSEKSLQTFMQTLDREKKIKQGISLPEIATWDLLIKKNERSTSR